MGSFRRTGETNDLNTWESRAGFGRTKWKPTVFSAPYLRMQRLTKRSLELEISRRYRPRHIYRLQLFNMRGLQQFPLERLRVTCVCMRTTTGHNRIVYEQPTRRPRKFSSHIPRYAKTTTGERTPGPPSFCISRLFPAALLLIPLVMRLCKLCEVTTSLRTSSPAHTPYNTLCISHRSSGRHREAIPPHT